MNLTVDTENLDDIIKRYAPGANEEDLKAATIAALNRCITHSRTKAVEAIADESGIEKRIIRRWVVRHNRKDKATWKRVRATIFGVVSPIDVKRLGAIDQDQTGVTVKTDFAGELNYPGAFITKVKAGKKGRKHKGVFQRVGKARLPIEKVVYRLPDNTRNLIKEAIQQYGLARFQERFPHELRRRKRRRKRAG